MGEVCVHFLMEEANKKVLEKIKKMEEKADWLQFECDVTDNVYEVTVDEDERRVCYELIDILREQRIPYDAWFEWYGGDTWYRVFRPEENIDIEMPVHPHYRYFNVDAASIQDILDSAENEVDLRRQLEVLIQPYTSMRHIVPIIEL